MVALFAACGGFLLGVLWMDLLFDVQVFAADPQAGVASIAAYYRRVTIDAYPMNRLIALVMMVALLTAIVGVARRRIAPRPGLTALALAAVPIGLAISRIFPNAMHLGAGAGDPAAQLSLARSICLEHILCVTMMGAAVTLMVRQKNT
jgi:hypothetical protein